MNLQLNDSYEGGADKHLAIDVNLGDGLVEFKTFSEIKLDQRIFFSILIGYNKINYLQNINNSKRKKDNKVKWNLYTLKVAVVIKCAVD